MFKIFGHYQHHPLHKDSKQEYINRAPPRRMQPPSIPISQPVRSPKFGPLPCPPLSTVLAKHDVLVWFEICELAPNGEYVPAVSFYFVLNEIIMFLFICTVYAGC